MDGNMLSNGYINCEFDSGNRLISAGGHTYTYNAEDVRIRNLCSDADTTYTYNTNCRLSQLLQKTTNGITTKYVYGLGLIGEEKCGEFKTYHFDFRGSTVAITDTCGNITDTFKYDTYGKLISRTGNSFVILGYNGCDGVITDRNGLLYMRARYYSPDMRRFVNADILHGEISDSASLNRYAFVNGNPISFIDPFGLSKERGVTLVNTSYVSVTPDMLIPVFPHIWEKYFGKYNRNSKTSIKKVFKSWENKILESLSEKYYLNYISLKKSNSNYENNMKYDNFDDFINDQMMADSSVGNMKLGDQFLTYNGCEVIAVYNATRLLGYDISLSKLIYDFERNNAVVGGGIIDGYFGSNPYSIDNVLRHNNISFIEVGELSLAVKGVYVASYWNSDGYDSDLHTIAINSDGDGNYELYNFDENGMKSTSSLDFSERLITAYCLTPETYYNDCANHGIFSI